MDRLFSSLHLEDVAGAESYQCKLQDHGIPRVGNPCDVRQSWKSTSFGNYKEKQQCAVVSENKTKWYVWFLVVIKTNQKQN